MLANTVVVAAREIVEKESGLAVGFEGGGVEIEALGDHMGDYGKSLAKFIDEAKNQVAMAYGGTAYKEAWSEGGFVVLAVSAA